MNLPCRSLVIYTFALSSPMLLSMFQGPSARKTFVVACKKCRRDVPTGGELSAEVHRSEAVSLCDPVMPVLDGLAG